jgi:hypothetical protein
MAVALAFAPMAVMVMPTMVDGRRGATTPVVHAFADHDHGAGRHAEDDLADHAQSRAQDAMPVLAPAAGGAAWTATTFPVGDQPVHAAGRVREPFEPPRA